MEQSEVYLDEYYTLCTSMPVKQKHKKKTEKMEEMNIPRISMLGKKIITLSIQKMYGNSHANNIKKNEISCISKLNFFLRKHFSI